MSLLAFMPLVDKVLGFIPNPAEKARVKAELEAADQRGELSLLLGQMEINKVEAAHPSIFISGWRPATGWVCSAALAYHFIITPFLDIWFVMPVVKVEQLYPILMGMLGLGGFRSFEKAKKVARVK